MVAVYVVEKGSCPILNGIVVADRLLQFEKEILEHGVCSPTAISTGQLVVETTCYPALLDRYIPRSMGWADLISRVADWQLVFDYE
jgi:hypothetical protein